MGIQKSRLNDDRLFFWAPKTKVKFDGEENIHNFMLKILVWLNLSDHFFCEGQWSWTNDNWTPKLPNMKQGLSLK